MSVEYDINALFFNKDYSQAYVIIAFKRVYIEFNWELKPDMTLIVDWTTIELGDAIVTTHIGDEKICSHPTLCEHFNEKQKDNKVVNYFFNWMFDLILPWANAFHPQSVSKFDVVTNYPGIVEFNDLKIEVHDSYLKLGLNPTFLK